MDFETILIYIFSSIVLALGVCILIAGKWNFYPDEDDSSIKIVISGGKARLIGFLLVISSFLLFSGNQYYGFAGLVISVLLPRLLSNSNN